MASAKDFLSKSSLQFGLDVYKECSSADRNVFLSPYSIAMALFMTNLGSKGNTSKQIKQTLHFQNHDDKKLNLAFKSLIKALDKSARENVTFQTANRIYVSSAILENFKKDLDNFFNAEVTNADFAKESAKTCREINQWVEEVTNNKIHNLILPNMLNALTKLVLINAVYFKGDWLQKFDKSKTVVSTFRTSQGNNVDVEMMREKAKFYYGESEQHSCKVLKLPYSGSTYSMIIVLPYEMDGIAKLESAINAEMLQDLMRNVHKIKVRVSLPKFKLEQSYDLKTVLSSLGITDLFSESDSDLSGISSQPGLYVSAAIHKAFVEVNEEGSEAAAATGIVMAVRSMPLNDMVFVADHPFLFLIRDENTEHVIFLGSLKVPEPASNKDEL